MQKRIKLFAKNDSGAVTTEFLVICAAVVALGVAGVSGLEDSKPQPEADVNDTLNRFTAGFE